MVLQALWRQKTSEQQCRGWILSARFLLVYFIVTPSAEYRGIILRNKKEGFSKNAKTLCEKAVFGFNF